MSQYDTINEFVMVGEFGFKRYEGPWKVSHGGTIHTVIMPYDEMNHTPGSHDEGNGAVLIADGQAVHGGIVETVHEPEGEGETHVFVDQYAMGDVEA